MSRDKYVVVLAWDQALETGLWTDALQRRGMNKSWKEWPIIYATNIDTADWESVLDQAKKIRGHAPDCDLTLALCPLHGEKHGGNYAFFPPKNAKKGYQEGEFFSTVDFIERAVRSGIFNTIYLGFCYGHLKVYSIELDQAEMPPGAIAVRVIAYESWIWGDVKEGTKAEIYFAKGLPLVKGGRYAPMDDTYTTDVFISEEGNLKRAMPDRIGKLRKRREDEKWVSGSGFGGGGGKQAK